MRIAHIRVFVLVGCLFFLDPRAVFLRRFLLLGCFLLLRRILLLGRFLLLRYFPLLFFPHPSLMHLLADPRELVHRRVVPPLPLLHPRRHLRHLLVQRLRLGLHGGLDREVRLSLLHALGEFLPQRDGFVHRFRRQPRHPTVRRLRAFLHDLRLHYFRHGVGERDHQLGVECSALVPGDFFPGRSGRGHLRL